MKPILLQGHTRSLTQIKYNREGDLLFTVSKDKIVNVWYSHNGERLGTYNGHVGTVWTVDVNALSTMLVTGSADNTARLWNVRTGQCLKTWHFPTAVKRVEFNEEGTMVLCVTEERMGHKGTITVLAVNPDLAAEQSETPLVVIENTEGPNAKAVVAGWSYLDKWIISGHQDGTLCKWDWKNQTKLTEIKKEHEAVINDLQFSVDRTYFITSSKDKVAKIFDVESMECRKTYKTDTPLNSASLTPKYQEFVILGGGQEAMDVTTTASRAGKFESRFYHKILQDEVGRVRGHFGPINTIAVHPDGKSYSSGGEDGYVRIHHFDPDYFKFKPENL